MSVGKLVLEIKDAVVRYAQFGLPIFGTWWTEDGQCACGSTECSAGKHPYGELFPHGRNSASSDPAIAEALWTTEPRMSIAVSLWHVGIVVLEMDSQEHVAQLAEWERQYGILPVTWRGVSGGKRLPHIWFRSPWSQDAPLAKNAIRLPSDVELKRDNVHVWPSVHVSGGRYEWETGLSPFDVELATLPDWLRQLAEGSAGEVLRVTAAIDGCLEDHIGVTKGVNVSRHDVATKLVGRCARDHGLPGLLERATVWNCRNRPPLPETEIRDIVDHIAKREAEQQGVAVPDFACRTNGEHDASVFQSAALVTAPTPVSLYDICQPEAASDIDWLWPGHIPRGMVTLLAGEAGVSKSSICCDWAARLSAGLPFPDGFVFPAASNVCFLNYEDDVRTVVTPRIVAAQGDGLRVVCHRMLVEHVSGQQEEFDFFQPSHVASLADMLRTTECVMFVVDPLMAALGGKKDVEHARPLMRILGNLAATLGIGVVAVTHYSKDETRSRKNRVLGSGQWVAAARVAWSIEEEPDTGRRILWPSKANIIRCDRGWAYQIEEVPADVSMVNRQQPTTRCVWEANHVNRPLGHTGNQEHVSALNEAVTFLMEELKQGPVPAKQIKKNAAGMDITAITLKRAKKEIGIASQKQPDGLWVWELPESLRATATETDSEDTAQD
ncbi:MAG: AAA family ATPase [Verrucomicrobia bacterium]|nr:AAA family ATPase [Verrucomicrobiota bacterium]